MKTIAANIQEANWEDDGGAHNVFLSTISDEDLGLLAAVEEPLGSTDPLILRVKAGKIAESDIAFPVSIDGVFSIWIRYGM